MRWAILAAPLVLWLLPNRFFDQGAIICPSRRFLGINCPGCGLTRATERLIHGQWEQAWQLNKLAYLTTPILFIIWLHVLGLVIKKPIFPFLSKYY